MATELTSYGSEPRNCRVCRSKCHPVNGNDGTGKIIVIRNRIAAFCGDCWIAIQAAV